VENAIGLYESLVADSRLKGYKPGAVLVDEDGKVYLSIKDAVHISKLSPERLRGLVSENRLDAIQPGGRDLFISLESVDRYLSIERREPGRPRKDQSQ